MVVCRPYFLDDRATYLQQLGRLTHYAFDAILLSAFLAGVKRSTGLTYVASVEEVQSPFPMKE